MEDLSIKLTKCKRDLLAIVVLYRAMTNSNDKKNKTTKTTMTIVTTLVIGLILLSPTTIVPNVHAQNITSVNSKLTSKNVVGLEPPSAVKLPQSPILSNTDQQSIINAAMNVAGLKKWSKDWKFVSMDFMGTKSDTNTTWRYAVVNIHVPSTKNAPFSCDSGWWARVQVDLTTKQVVGASYPTIESHQCHGIRLTSTQQKYIPTSLAWLLPLASANSLTPGRSMAAEDDVTTTTLYGNYAELQTPSFSSSIYNDMDEYIAQTLNAEFSPNSDFAQAGWIITVPAETSYCSSCNVSGNSANLVFVDTSTYGNEDARNINYTGSWVGGQTEKTEVWCNGGSSSNADYVIAISYGTFIFNHTTQIPCSDSQDTSDTNNSVWFENYNTSTYTNWENDISSGAIQATNAYEFDANVNYANWSSSTAVDYDCNQNPTNPSAVLTNGLASGATATWQYLNYMPYAC